MWVEDTLWCDGCGVEIVWPPLIKGSQHYCCQDCLDGLQCACGERMELEEERRLDSSAEISLSGADMP